MSFLSYIQYPVYWKIRCISRFIKCIFFSQKSAATLRKLSTHKRGCDCNSGEGGCARSASFRTALRCSALLCDFHKTISQTQNVNEQFRDGAKWFHYLNFFSASCCHCSFCWWRCWCWSWCLCFCFCSGKYVLPLWVVVEVLLDLTWTLYWSLFSFFYYYAPVHWVMKAK